MKALSIAQPWADLIIRGEKWLEFRTWATDYRGPLALHVSKGGGVFTDEHGDTLPTGVVLAVMELVDCREMAAEDLSHLGAPEIVTGCVWEFGEEFDLLEPIKVMGRQKLFDVPESVIISAPEGKDWRDFIGG